ncbi:MAG: tetratricopeptide (TPR) repeat protein [Myxococcota bacterium]|jgi:tetratricopeptide (TPR) repeat protein
MNLAPSDYDFGDASNYSFAATITCANDDARKMYVRAFGHMLDYNHEQAIACFSKCTELDPGCAMAWWGIAYCVSSNYNWAPGFASGHDAIQKAVALKAGVSELEQDLIDAMAKRHSAEARDAANPAELSMGNKPELNLAFAEAMAPLYEKYTGNLDVAALYVESLMNLNPWQLWQQDTKTGEITPVDDNTLLCVKVMEDAFETVEGAKVHPALCHLYCHTMELSPYPEKALPAADVLRTLMPGFGHLVHMPSHIDAWVGQWSEAIECNIAAVAADDKYVEQSGNESQFYKFYRMHNHHFVVWCAMFDGQYETALKYARKAEAMLPAGDKDSGVQFMLAGIIPMGAIFLESYVTMPWHVMVRFGKWDDIINEPTRTDKAVFPATIATQHYARGVAYASKGMVAEAEVEAELFEDALKNPALAGRVLHNNLMYQDPEDGPCVLLVNAAVLAGEIEYRKQFQAKARGETADFKAAFDHLRRGVDLSLNLAYNEPWGQMQPVRHILGALLFEQGEVVEAEAVYRADIKLWKKNMWGLLGLKLCLEARGDAPEELAKVTALFKESSVRADIVPAKTCFCAQDSIEKSCCASE